MAAGQMKASKGLQDHGVWGFSMAGQLHLGWIILCCGGYHVGSSAASLGLCAPHANSTPTPVMTIKLSPDIAKCPLGSKVSPAENQ